MADVLTTDLSGLRLLPPRRLLAGTAVAKYDAELSRIQQFRGAVYLADRAIPKSALDEHGRLHASKDTDRWHVYICNPDGRLAGCGWVSRHEPRIPFSMLHLAEFTDRLPLCNSNTFKSWVDEMRRVAITEEMVIGEVGGWAAETSQRRSRQAILFPFCCWALLRILGHALVITAATTRHGSATMLQRLGGFSPLPPFFDPFHQCEIEVVAFDSRVPPKLFAELADRAEVRITALAAALGISTAATQRSS